MSINLLNVVLGVYVVLIILYVLGKFKTSREKNESEEKRDEKRDEKPKQLTEPSFDQLSNENAPSMTDDWKQGARERILNQSIYCPKCGRSNPRRLYSNERYTSALWCGDCGKQFISRVPSDHELWRVFFAECPCCSNVDLRLNFEKTAGYTDTNITCPKCKQTFAELALVRKWSESA
jgi:transposase-like protein